ncbi:gamma-glutamyltransferase family protein [Paralcaligenes sp. KSB-10]|uniref:gamma-glutamyltransferase family protein n=1 Tax=Paralcaligenes sp. KSB-10 TaxID=2901142 RepID=UPI001E381261|nr:gamma-glutamyltransferase family protein [Paralcaligenes sp. KSB-10]UHL65394.1 gamma-glutamyltransferase family protein [Paralcaligenes sp. KSB-10]
MFTTRPEITGTFGVVTSTHWLATAVGMSMLERGGNAFDACVASAFVLHVVEPNLVGPAGEVPGIFYSAATKKIEVLCGQGTTPGAATLDRYRAEGLTLIPGNGLLAAVVPGAFDAWMILLRDHGTKSLRDVLEPAIYYAQTGHPLLPRVSNTIASMKDFFEAYWPTSAEVYLPQGAVPKGKKLFCNPALANTWRRLLTEAESVGGNREKQIEMARQVFYKGFVAEAIDRFASHTEVMDESGAPHKGVIRGDDMARWSASYEAPLQYQYGNINVAKTGPWSQGPTFLQVLALLKHTDISSLKPGDPRFVHLLVEAMKLAFADREAYYGDPDFIDVPLSVLLSDDYNRVRSCLIGDRAFNELSPGIIPGYEAQVARVMAVLNRLSPQTADDTPLSAMDKANRLVSAKKGDTTHIDVIDRWGNMIAATPSGGWLQSSPVIPGLGFGLNTRAQMFWLEEGLPGTLAPYKRPRTTLSPTFLSKDGVPYMAFGTPGGDQQEQWQLILFLRHIQQGFNLQEAIDMPMFHTQHFPSSFYPRGRKPGNITIESSYGREVIDDLQRRGHQIEESPEWSIGRLTAVSRDEDGLMHAAASPRLLQAYAAGR